MFKKSLKIFGSIRFSLLSLCKQRENNTKVKKMQNTNKDLIVANERLFELKESITAKDKQKLYAEMGLNPATVSKYLNRKGTDLDTAMSLLSFFMNCIAKRREVLAKAC